MNYKRIYNEIINHSKTRTLNGYKENHHITPKCVGGSDLKSNIATLTAREHYICHWLLIKMYPDQHKLMYAFNMMHVHTLDQERYTSKMHESNRRKLASIISKTNKGRPGYNKGVPMPEHLRAAISDEWHLVHPDGTLEHFIGLNPINKKYPHLNPSTLHAVCKGKRSHHKGYKLIKLTNITDGDNIEYVNKPYPTGRPAVNRQPIVYKGVEYESKAACCNAHDGLYPSKLNNILRKYNEQC